MLNNKFGCLLKPPKNLTHTQRLRPREALAINLKSVRAYLLRDAFQLSWENG